MTWSQLRVRQGPVTLLCGRAGGWSAERFGGLGLQTAVHVFLPCVLSPKSCQHASSPQNLVIRLHPLLNSCLTQDQLAAPATSRGARAFLGRALQCSQNDLSFLFFSRFANPGLIPAGFPRHSAIAFPYKVRPGCSSS